MVFNQDIFLYSNGCNEYVYKYVQVQVSIDKVRNTLMVATRNCFSAPDTNTIIQVKSLNIGASR